MRQLTLVCQQSSKVLPQSHHILQHSIAHQCLTCSNETSHQLLLLLLQKVCARMRKLGSQQRSTRMLLLKGSCAPSQHTSCVDQTGGITQPAACNLLGFNFLFCLVVVHKQQSNANLADATNYARMLPRRTQKMCAPCSAPKTSVPSLIKRPCTVGSVRLVKLAHRERESVHRFPSTHKNVRCKKYNCDSFSMHKRRLH